MPSGPDPAKGRAALATPSRGAFASRASYFLPQGLRRKGRAMIVYGEDSFEADPVRGLQECAAALERLRNDPSWRRFNRDRTPTRIPGVS